MNPDPSISSSLIGAGVIALIIFFVVMIGLSAFWLWMLIEVCTRKDFDHRVLWIILMVFFGPLVSIIYYFMEHRAYRVAQKAVVMTPAMSAPVAPVPTPEPVSVPSAVAPAVAPESDTPSASV
jgi:hypothetical protein